MTNTNPEQASTKHTIQEELRRLASLYLDATKFTVAEKGTVLLSAAFICVVALLLGMAVLVFVSLGVVHLLACCMPLWLVFFIMGAFLILVLVVLYLLREKIVYDPMARFVSRLILTPPKSVPHDKGK